MAQKKNSISTESYKGVRDFYPQDMFIQKYIFGVMADTAESMGYSEYSASLLEASELYEAKTGDEIVNEQTYTFEDRGGRKVTLRPEMTPTVARMVAARKRDLSFPLRWYSIPNLFRYERPQKGRLREHWQLNVDIFGIAGIEADAEIMQVAYEIMRKFGAEEKQFEIRINSRKLINRIYTYYGLSDDEQKAVSKLIDKKDKITLENFKQQLQTTLSHKEGLSDLFFELTSTNDLNALPDKLAHCDEKKELESLMEQLNKLGITNSKVDTGIMRGFDYYTGIVFEVYDVGPENNRSLFGGGRYDDLLEIFDVAKIPTVGFGMGDVTMCDFLETYELMPSFSSSTDLYICILDNNAHDYAQFLALSLRKEGVNVALDYTGKKAGDQIKYADKSSIPYVLCVGAQEVKSNTFNVKNLKTGAEKTVSREELKKVVRGN